AVGNGGAQTLYAFAHSQHEIRRAKLRKRWREKISGFFSGGDPTQNQKAGDQRRETGLRGEPGYDLRIGSEMVPTQGKTITPQRESKSKTHHPETNTKRSPQRPQRSRTTTNPQPFTTEATAQPSRNQKAKPTTEALRHGEKPEKTSCTAEARRRGEEFYFDEKFAQKTRKFGISNPI